MTTDFKYHWLTPDELQPGDLVYSVNPGARKMRSLDMPVHVIIDYQDVQNAHWYFAIPLEHVWEQLGITDTCDCRYLNQYQHLHQLHGAELIKKLRL